MRRALVWLAAGATLLAGMPFFSVLTAGTVANWRGCRLHEGFANPCVIAGTDWGETLYAMGVMGWLMLVTWPFMLLSLIGWPIHGVMRWRRRRA